MNDCLSNNRPLKLGERSCGLIVLFLAVVLLTPSLCSAAPWSHEAELSELMGIYDFPPKRVHYDLRFPGTFQAEAIRFEIDGPGVADNGVFMRYDLGGLNEAFCHLFQRGSTTRAGNYRCGFWKENGALYYAAKGKDGGGVRVLRSMAYYERTAKLSKSRREGLAVERTFFTRNAHRTDYARFRRNR